MPPKIAKLAGLGAFAACAGIAALFLLFVYGTRPTASAGMDGTLRFISWLSVAGVLLALLGVHLLIGRRLLALARGDNPPPDATGRGGSRPREHLRGVVRPLLDAAIPTPVSV
jgi:hypothetical protein